MCNLITLQKVLDAFPGRNWVTAKEVAGALGLNVSPDKMGKLLGGLSIPRSLVRVGASLYRIWCIRGEPGEFTTQVVKSELVAHGCPHPDGLFPARGKATVVRLRSPSPSTR